MSFILDALRKSEHARQKQTGPGLAEVPVVVQRPRSNVWATAAVVLLVVNLLAVGILLLHRAQQEDAVAAPSGAAAPPTDGPNPASPPSSLDSGPAPTNVPRAAPGVTRAPAVVESSAPSGGVPAARNPLAAELGGSTPSADALDPTLAAGAASVPDGPRAVSSAQGGTRRGSVVYAPVPEADDAPYSAPPPAAVSTRETQGETLPTADEVAAKGGMPELHLDLHVFASVPQQRFIFVNSRKYKEGDTLQEGPLVEQITRDGAVLAYRGSRFKLSND